nr:hypothetical protein [uncultured Mediterranean phage uvMED]
MSYTTIDRPTDYFDTKLYTGTASNNITLTMDNIAFLWIKRRNATGNHVVFDSARGGHYTGSGAKPVLIINSTAAGQGTDIDSATKGIDFGSTSTVIGSDSQGYNYNTSGGTYVAWHWGTGTSVSGTTTGSGTGKAYSGSVNITSGFSVISYIGNGTANHTLPHHLGVVPKMLIIKNRTSSGYEWSIYHHTLGNEKRMFLNDTSAAGSSTAYWNNTSPTSSVINLGSGGAVNENNSNMIAYCFAEKKGYSKFGSYVGNGSNSGPYIHLGFKPAFVIIKPSSYSNSWLLLDSKRPGYNVTNQRFEADGNGAEYSGLDYADFLSNGFKIRTSNSHPNNSGGTLIYMAFAESPFVTSTGIPTTAK